MVNPAVARRLPPGAASKKKDSPPILSWEFLVVNHGDICSVLVTIMVIGVMFAATQNYCFPFMWMNYNVTSVEEVRAARGPNDESGEMLYSKGPLDALNVIFYTIVMILLHAIIQEFGIDKIVKKFHLSRYRTSQFIESTHLALFSTFSILFGTYILSQSKWLLKRQPDLLWSKYPMGSNTMTMMEKFFCIIQLSYWVHWYAELFLQRIKRDEWAKRITYISLYILCIASAYLSGYTRLLILLLSLQYLADSIFHVARLLQNSSDRKQYASMMFAVWNVVFPIVRVASIGVSILVLLKPRTTTIVKDDLATKSNETDAADASDTSTGSTDAAAALGNWRQMTSYIALGIVSLVNIWMLYNFLIFHVKRWQSSGGGGFAGFGIGGGKSKLAGAKAAKTAGVSQKTTTSSGADSDSGANSHHQSSADEKSPKVVANSSKPTAAARVANNSNSNISSNANNVTKSSNSTMTSTARTTPASPKSPVSTTSSSSNKKK